MSKGKFGGDAYKPKQLGPEPAAPPVPLEPQEPSQAYREPQPLRVQMPATVLTQAKLGSADSAELAALRTVKVPYSSRITVAADRQLKAMAKQGRSQTDLLAEALNLLFKKHGLDQNA